MSPEAPARPRPSAALPRPVRNAAFGCLVLAGMVGFGAAQEMAVLANLAEAREKADTAAPSSMEPELYRALVEVQLKGLEGMRASRLLIMAALATASALCFVSAVRLLRPTGLSRESVRRLLGRSALAAAVLRTLDGAQATALMRKVGAAFARLTADAPWATGVPEGFRSLLPPLIVAGMTALIAGGFAALSLYFRSEKVKQIVAFADRGP
ncbi:MAG: hypothetical protein HYZ28_10080 [Myxococcales bacterium]|nr:hypothetical protein [Myxococcales bacterium]